MNARTKEEPSLSTPRELSRREFARQAALASAVASLGPAMAAAPLALAAAPSRTSPTVNLTQTPGLPKLSPESQAEVEARIQTIFSQYGSRFSEEQKTDLRRLCALAQQPLDRLRAYALDNGDGPALYLKPLVEREKNPLEKTRVGKTPSGAKP